MNGGRESLGNFITSLKSLEISGWVLGMGLGKCTWWLVTQMLFLDCLCGANLEMASQDLADTQVSFPVPGTLPFTVSGLRSLTTSDIERTYQACFTVSALPIYASYPAWLESTLFFVTTRYLTIATTWTSDHHTRLSYLYIKTWLIPIGVHCVDSCINATFS